MPKKIDIPDAFWNVPYNGAHYPGASGVAGLTGGANCQHFAYELLRHNGFSISDLRSSDLWEDTFDTAPVIDSLHPGDLLLFHAEPVAWGAHVALYLGEDQAIHLAKRIGKPVVWTLAAFSADPLYACFIGAKRPIRCAERLS